MTFSCHTKAFRALGKRIFHEFSEKSEVMSRGISKNCEKQGNIRCHSNSRVDREICNDSTRNFATFRENPKTWPNKGMILSSECATTFSPKISPQIVEKKIFNQELFTDDFLKEIEESERTDGPLDPCRQDLSDITPNIEPGFNFAAYANDSPIIQELVKLGVDFHKVEKKRQDMAHLLINRNFEDVKPHIRFLHDCGVPGNEIGAVITKNPAIVAVNLDNLHTRIRYLRAHAFSKEAIARIVTKNPFWLLFNTKKIDGRLGYFQREFLLDGQNVRTLATKQPRLITYRLQHVRENTFAMREEMGFDKEELKRLVLSKPRLLMMNRTKIVETFDFAHNKMHLSHALLLQEPNILTCRVEKLRQRHKFLETVQRAQYDPEKPMYVSLNALISGTDAEFCVNVAKTSVLTYNRFLKSL